MTVGGRIRLVRLAACGIFLLLPAGWAASRALAEEAPVPTVPAPTTVAPDPVPQPPVATPRPDPAPRPRATPSPAPAPAPRATSQPRVFTPPRVAPPPAAGAARAAQLKAKARAEAKAKAKAKARAKARARAKPVATVVRADPPVSSLARPIVTIELVRSDDGRTTSNAFLSSVMAFLAGLLIPVALVAAAVLARRRRRPAASAMSATSAPAPVVAPPMVRPEPAQHVLPPAVVETEQRPPAAPPLARPESRPVLPPAVAETEQRQPAPTREEQPPSEREETVVPEPIEAAAAAEWAGWEFCEIDWWRGYVKSHFFAKATTPGDAEYIVRESPLFRWRGNGIPEATPETIAVHKQLIESLRAEGWEDDPGTPSSWYAQTFRRQQDPDTVTR